MQDDYRLENMDFQPSQRPALQKVGAGGVSGFQITQLSLFQNSSNSCARQKLQRLCKSFHSWLQPEKQQEWNDFPSGPGTVYDQQVLQWQVHIDGRIGIMWQKPGDIHGRCEWWLHEAPWLGPCAHAGTGSPLFWGSALKRNPYSSNKTVANRIPTEANVGTPSCTPQDISLQSMKDKEMKIKKMVATFIWKLLK